MPKKKSVSPFSERIMTNKVRWSKQLPPTYETILAGLNAKMTITELAEHLGWENTPAQIKNVKLGSFTPDVFQHEDFKEFFEAPVTPYDLYDHAELFNAIDKDKDIERVLNHLGFKLDKFHMTRQAVVQVLQIIEVGYEARKSELTSKNIYNRVEKLKDPAYYENFLKLPLIQKYALENELPKTAPKFNLSHERFSVKDVTSAMEKAYFRSGRTLDMDDFLETQNKRGIFAIKDIQRLSILIPDAKFLSPEQVEEKFNPLRNVLTVAIESGELGVIPLQLKDSLHYPESERATDQLPIYQANVRVLHKGIGDSILDVNGELQLKILPDHADKTTHDMSRITRNERNDDVKTKNERSRIDVMEMYISNKTLEKRKIYNANKIVDPEDKIAKLFLNQSQGMFSRAAEQRAIEVARSEFPDEESTGKGSFRMLDPHNVKDKYVFAALREIIRTPQEDQHNVKVVNMRGVQPVSISNG